MLNRYPLWKYLLLTVLILFGLVYAAPNVFGEDPAVQVSVKSTSNVTGNVNVLGQVKQALAAQHISYLTARDEQGKTLVRLASTDVQLKARDTLKTALGDDYNVALNLASRTPGWLQALGAQPMKLGLDLRGGVHFLLDVDVQSVIKARQDGDINALSSTLRDKQIRYTDLSRQQDQLVIQFRDTDNLDKAMDVLPGAFPDYQFATSKTGNAITGTLTPAAVVNIGNYAVDQNMSILANRVNELGVSEAIVQRQGQTQISVDLPGVQDTARAKELIGKTDTLRFHLVDTEGDVQAAAAGNVPLGSRLYQYESSPILLKNQAVLTGSSITYATATIGENGRPAVSIRLGGGGESLFSRVTAENIGKPLAVVYVETIPRTQVVNGQTITTQQQVERIINVATIKSALGNSFEITGLDSPQYAQNLALLLRSGALVAPVNLVQERTVGPSLGAANIEKGILSILVGGLAVMIFMMCYYRVFGVVANMALLLNVVFIIAVLSMLGATLTLPGIAGIVLNVGMAVDANVLIYERIREELRLGMSPQASIHAGYERAFATIVDANVTTLIVSLILFALGGGVVKGFAITLTIGILTSMITAIFFTRAIVNKIYGGRNVKSLSIGIRVAPKAG
jgi:preprotein translocase subunit SecD